jgi:hypothetical protein
LTRPFSILASGAAALMLAAGCPAENSGYKELSEKDAKTTAPVEGHDHEHGPHEGHIVELKGGDHGEIVLEPTRELTLYLLDGAVKNAVPADNPSGKLNLKLGAETKTFELKSMPQDGEKDGKSSRLRTAEPLPESIKDIDDVAGDIDLTIAGATEKAVIEAHEHEHEAPAAK